MAQTLGSIDLASLKNLRDDVTQYFWFESNSSSAWGSGAHVTLYPESQFTDSTSPNYMRGKNIIMNTDGFSIRNGGLPMMVLDNDSLDFNAVDTSLGTYTTMATFGLTGATIGRSSSAHSVIDANGQRFYATDGTTQLANIGYGEGVNALGGTSVAPYYTFGIRNSTTVGNYSVAEGLYTIASGYCSYAEGYFSIADGSMAHAEGNRTYAYGYCSHAEGIDSVAGVESSPQEGRYSHAEGESTYAEGKAAHSEGGGAEADGDYSHAQNRGTIAKRLSQTVIGEFNKADTYGANGTERGNYSFIIGNGTADNARSNALTVDWDGHVVATSAKKDIVYTGEYIMLYGNQTDVSVSAGKVALSTTTKNCLPANKYSTFKSPLADDLYSVSNGEITILKAGRYRLSGQIYLYNGFAVDDVVYCSILSDGTGANSRASRCKAFSTALYETLIADTITNPASGTKYTLASNNGTAARGTVGLNGYTRLMIECLGIYES